MEQIDFSPNNLVAKLLEISETRQLSLLDSCGATHLGSHLLIAGIDPVETFEFSSESARDTLEIFTEKISDPTLAGIFTISYDFGQKLQNIPSHEKENSSFSEPDISLALFDCLIIHDYKTGETHLSGNRENFQGVKDTLFRALPLEPAIDVDFSKTHSNFSKAEYFDRVECVLSEIREGDTYQTNLTQQFHSVLSEHLAPQVVFSRLRDNHPAPFAAFLRRENDYVVSISPERFALIEDGHISTSPIKGTRPRGATETEDAALRNELIESEKDRAENTMIVDLLRNDIGRICEFGSVSVEKLCEIEEHPTFFNLVSTISGRLRNNVTIPEIISAIFPCGSITGCPKISTMKIIDDLETANRGLSMGAIGYCDFKGRIDLSVAIRTAVIRGREAQFNVGGGIVIESDLETEYQESLLKSRAILAALNSDFDLSI